jgi:hypothetical protein
MSVKTLDIRGVEINVRVRGLGLAKARLIVRERPSSYSMNRYLYLVYRNGDKIKEHYLGKLSNE